jgi:hypothetical protein
VILTGGSSWQMRDGDAERHRRSMKLVEEVLLSSEEETGEGGEWVRHEATGLWCLLLARRGGEEKDSRREAVSRHHSRFWFLVGGVQDLVRRGAIIGLERRRRGVVLGLSREGGRCGAVVHGRCQQDMILARGRR